MQKIDITPTWEGLLPVMIQVLRNPKANPSSIKEITGELMRLAKFADDANKSKQ